LSNKTHLIIPDTHAHYNYNNERANYLGKFLAEVKPDVVIHLGDSADMPSLSGYEKGKKSFHGRTYKADIEAHLDFNERLWHYCFKSKKKRPYRVILEGNHEHRISRAIEIQPELEGTVGLSDLQIPRWYQTFVPYEGGTPGVALVDGIHYAHYFISGVMGRPISGEHPAFSLLSKQYSSCTAGHLHLLDHTVRTDAKGRQLHGLLAGVYQDYESDWAGEANKLWWRGVVLKRNVDGQGNYDPSFISLDWLKRNYSG
jgi:hypothetical protein